MAIIQISRIQHRRGMSDNIPQLASAELGWAIDARKLFIGNGTLAEGAPTLGNTEILTVYSDIVSLANSYIYKGDHDGLAPVQTGIDLLSPISRSMQSKLDDIVSARDFGTIGDSSTNNAPMLNRAIEEVYHAAIASAPSSEESKRRTIHIPAGVYYLTGDFIRLLPYVKLKGDGKNSTFIVQTDATQPCVAQSVDSAGQYGAAIGTNGASTPTGLQIEDMTLINQTNGDVLILDSVTDTLLRRTRCVGNKVMPITVSTSRACVRIQATASTTRNVLFDTCDFLNHTFAVQADGDVAGVVVLGGLFNGLYAGLSIGEYSATVPTGIRVMHSVFESVARQAIATYTTVTGVVSAFNHYKNVGNDHGASMAAFPVLSFLTGDNYSLADQFDRTPADSLIMPPIDANNQAVISTLPGGILSLGNYKVASATEIVLADHQPTSTPTGAYAPVASSVTINYSLTRGALVRHGVMKIVNDGTAIAYDDEFMQTGDLKVVITPVLNGGAVELNYVSETSGGIPVASTLKAATKYLA